MLSLKAQRWMNIASKRKQRKPIMHSFVSLKNKIKTNLAIFENTSIYEFSKPPPN